MFRATGPRGFRPASQAVLGARPDSAAHRTPSASVVSGLRRARDTDSPRQRGMNGILSSPLLVSDSNFGEGGFKMFANKHYSGSVPSQLPWASPGSDYHVPKTSRWGSELPVILTL